jgi:Glycosyltransferase (GlcNAc)
MISLRAFTHGYDLYHPHVILGWHEYKRATRVTHWDDHEGWWKKEAASLFRMRSVFTGKYRGRFGPGKRRSIKEFEEHIGQPLYVPGEDNVNAIF